MIFLGREISEQRNYGDKIADKIDSEVDSLIETAHQTAVKILTERRAKLEQFARRLIAEETIEGDTLEKLFNEPVPETELTPVPSLQTAPASSN